MSDKIVPKTQKEIAVMRAAGVILGRVLKEIRDAVKPNVRIIDLNALAEQRIREAGAVPAFLGYSPRTFHSPMGDSANDSERGGSRLFSISSRAHDSPKVRGEGFPSALCVSVNDEVVHGNGKRVRELKEGDIAGLDLGLTYEGLIVDSAITVGVGKISKEARRLIQVTRDALTRALEVVREGARVGDVSAAIQEYVERNGFGVVRDLCGHGVGRVLHEPPEVPNFGTKGTGPMLVSGVTLAIEPMVTAGDWHVQTLADGWTVVTVDGSISAHFEHTVVVTRQGCEVLTMS